MAQQIAASGVQTSGTPSKTSLRVTRALLACGIVAGPIYIVAGAIQAATRAGFDIRRHDISLLSNGDLGWIQITNFVLTGLLTIAGAIGMWRVLRGSQGGTWGPLLVGVYGLGLIGAGFFIADPALGFPPGTPADAHTMSGHGFMHLVSGGIGFLGLIVACFVFSRRFASLGQRGWSAYSLATGVIFFAAFVGIAVGSNGSGAALTAAILAFSVAVILAWAWIAVMAARLWGVAGNSR